MSKYNVELKQLDLPHIDKVIRKFWEENEIFKKSVENRSTDNSFVFYEGPPSANGKPGIHHVMGRTVKDLFCRFQTMKGKRVERKGGWDTHGLPIELSVEKELGITKEDIGTKISVDEYNAMCRKTVMQYKDLWDDITRKMGYWVDLDNPYITFNNEYIESVWWLLKQLYNKDLLYKGYTIQPYSPAAGTGLSSHELNQPGCYRDVTDTTIVAQFRTIHESLPEFLTGFGDIHMLAWTTTPWTLPSNTALTVGPKIDYVLIATYNQYTFQPIKVILAKSLVESQFSGKFLKADSLEALDAYTESDKKIPYFILQECKGEQLIGIRYEQLLPYALPYQHPENAFRVIGGSFVTTEDGTGIVHTAPTFGADDAKVAKEARPEVPPMLVLDENDNPVPLVDLQGRFRAELVDIGGKYVKNEYYKDGEAPEKSVDVEIAIRLKEENKAFKVEKYVHNYPHCWRTDKPVLYYPLDSWFIKSTAMKDKMIELNKTINWKPAHTGEKRFGNWLENLNDWNLSRSRYWGIPLPIWRTEDAAEEICIESIEHLKQEVEKSNRLLGLTQLVPDDLHRPYIDEVVLVSGNGLPMKRELDLIDVWFDSGSMPYAQWHYPMENRDLIDKGITFPADFIAEGVDQTRGWFFTLHAIASMVFESVAYKNVVSNGLVLDKNGVKMSKRLGNVIDPFETIEQYGADATRWYMISNAQPWDNLKFDLEGIDEVKRKFFGTLFNTWSFYALYANIDGFTYDEKSIPVIERQEIDRWIISLLNSLIQEVDEEYSNYEPTNATRKIMAFVDEHLSNWYVRLCRRRFWKGEYSEDKIAAYQTLYECLVTIAKLSSPVAPMFSEWLYKSLNDVTQLEGFESVHLTDFPVSDTVVIDKALEQRMDYAQRISSLVLSIRKKEGHRVRQPLSRILLPVLDTEFITQIDSVKELILSEVNVKTIEYITETDGFITKKAKANFKTLGKRLGKHMKEGAQIIQEMDQAAIRQLEKDGQYTITIDDTAFDLLPEDFEITFDEIPGWQVATDRDIVVALDINLTDELIAEGTARELVNRIQNLRKTSNFDVTDKITIYIEDNDSVRSAVVQFGDYIKSEVLGVDIILDNITNGEIIELSETLSLHIHIEKA
ncbi:MAG TPA: isoleucine--tRNA ligase [Saprospiraceae bacterium]|jgi:isoleucyl-tRNA synthetase|nr:isoleucine--tRNA ligase [Saprospiraceae bacterium]HRO08825.1 isoleucine--tRNA ligase [Saprospiraceae bacterium]HRP42086.1 isoleucine--tRNA ligase [Saprospiraceae bacterium]